MAFSGFIRDQPILLPVASAALALEGVRLIVNVLSVIPLVMGIAGFFVHTRDRRWLDADTQARGEEEQSQDKGSS